MAEQILMIALSPTMEEGTIAGWNKKEGDPVSSGDVLCEVETDKAAMDYESTQEGTLLKILVGDGGSAGVGEPIAVIGDEGDDIEDLLTGSGGTVEQKAEPEKTEAPSPPAPGTPAPAQPAGSAEEAPAVSGRAGGRVKSSPLARKMAQMQGVDITSVQGSGPDGRVVKRDIEDAVKHGTGGGAPAAEGAAGAPGEDRRIPHTQKRKVIAKRLSESKFQAPHYYLKITADMETVMNARSVLNRKVPEKVSFNAFLVKLTAMALGMNPGVNASWQEDAVVEFGSVDIGLAVDLGNGLITPVIRNCRNKGLLAIDREMKDLIKKAGEGKLTPDEYSGATFSISNLGSFGIEEFTAIINPPGSAILAVGKIEKKPAAGDDGSVQLRPRMTMTLSCDHRVIDGAAGAKFLSDLKEMLENPVSALY